MYSNNWYHKPHDAARLDAPVAKTVFHANNATHSITINTHSVLRANTGLTAGNLPIHSANPLISFTLSKLNLVYALT
jgi:hypothetical protein